MPIVADLNVVCGRKKGLEGSTITTTAAATAINKASKEQQISKTQEETNRADLFLPSRAFALPSEIHHVTQPLQAARSPINRYNALFRCRNKREAHGRNGLQRDMAREEKRARRRHTVRPTTLERMTTQQRYVSELLTARMETTSLESEPAQKRMKLDQRPRDVVLLDHELTRTIGDIFT